MPSTFEDIMAALQAQISAAVSATVLRGEVLPTKIPAAGLIILRDGEPGEAEMTMSPLTWHYEHVASAEIYTSVPSRDAAFDIIRTELGAAIAADRSLGGLCDWVEAEAPSMEDLPVEGGATIKAAIVPIQLHYATTDPLN
jgi:hypothetical protein